MLATEKVQGRLLGIESCPTIQGGFDEENTSAKLKKMMRDEGWDEKEVTDWERRLGQEAGGHGLETNEK